jgi:hypothetical protein
MNKFIVTTWYSKPGKQLEQSARKILFTQEAEDAHVAAEKLRPEVNAVEVVNSYDLPETGIRNTERFMHLRSINPVDGTEYWNVGVDPIQSEALNIPWVVQPYDWQAAWDSLVLTGRLPA